MKLVVGLGNPGEKYKNTRHNIGFMSIDYIVSQFTYEKDFIKDTGINAMVLFQNKFIDQKNEKILYMKPLTFMNDSGESIKKAIKKYNIKNDDVLILYDEVDIPFNEFKLKTNGKTSHNGIKNIIKCLETDEFPRIKLGIGKPDKDIVDYVLEKFSKEDSDKLKSDLFPTIFKMVNEFANGEKAESLVNKIKE